MSGAEFILDISKFDPKQPRDWRGRWVDIGDTLNIGGELFEFQGKKSGKWKYKNKNTNKIKSSVNPLHTKGEKIEPGKGSGSSANPSNNKPRNKPSADLTSSITTWTSSPNVASKIRSAGNDILEGNFSDTPESKAAHAFLNKISSAKPVKKELYRGMIVDSNRVKVDFAKGKVVDTGLSSFSSSDEVAEYFFNDAKSNQTKLLISLQPGSKALDLVEEGKNVPSPDAREMLDDEEEFLVAGKLKVLSSDMVEGVLIVEVEQVGVYDVS
jgi:hypothetical protein